MSWGPFLAGLSAGWLIEPTADYFSWRPDHSCQDAEEKLQEATAILKQGPARLQPQEGAALG